MNKEEIIDYIKQNNGVEIPTLQKKFGITYKEARSVVDELLEKGELVYVEGVRYEYAERKPGLEPDDEDEDDKEEDFEELMAKRRADLEARKQELIKKMQEGMKEDGKYAYVDEDDEDIDVDDTEDFRYNGKCSEFYMLHELRSGLNVRFKQCPDKKTHYICSVNGLKLKNRDVEFEMFRENDKFYIKDNYETIAELDKVLDTERDDIKEEIERIADRYGVIVADDELILEVTAPDEALACLMRFFAAMEALLNIKEYEVIACADRKKSDERYWEIISELAHENNEIDRTQAIARVREMWDEAQSRDDLDAVYDYVYAVRDLNATSDEEFEGFRKLLLFLEIPDDGTEDSDDAEDGDETESSAIIDGDVTHNAIVIQDIFSKFGIAAKVCKVSAGAAVTRYSIKIPDDIDPSDVLKHSEDINICLCARGEIRMYNDFITGTIAVEVPNNVGETVPLSYVTASEEYASDKIGSMMFAIGKDLEGKAVCGNLVKMTHIFVGGSTGSGKSTFLHSMIASLISKYSPEELKLLLIDPKQVEFAIYRGLPHLLTDEIVVEEQPAINALQWVVKEMELRYALYDRRYRKGKYVRNIDEYNSSCEEDEKKLPRIVVIIDEFASFMVAGKDFEYSILCLTQKARAAGIYVILSTLYTSSDVIPEVIKANIPTRVAFRTAREKDSRVIIDEPGAEKLLGHGDMLLKTVWMPFCSRIQGAYVSCEELSSIVESVKDKYKTDSDESNNEHFVRVESGSEDENEEVPPMYIEVLASVVKSGKASVSFIQRECKVGYGKANRIIGWMESMGYVSCRDDKTNSRTVLITKEEFKAKYGPLD